MDISEINEGAERFCAECGRLLRNKIMRGGEERSLRGEYAHFCRACVKRRKEEGVGTSEPTGEEEIELDRNVDDIVNDILATTKKAATPIQPSAAALKRFKPEI